MGVHGLMSLIDENSNILFRDYDLFGSLLVVDGSSLAYNLYYKEHINFTFGGDYFRLWLEVEKFIDTLRKCDIVPVVIFDGPVDPNDRKYQTSIHRQENRLREAASLCSRANAKTDKRHIRLLPLLVFEVLLERLADLDVPFVVADGEADSILASVANALHCPVLSLDSDFHIFDLKCGYIPFSGFSWDRIYEQNTVVPHYSCLKCTLFHVDDLLECFPGVKREVLPLFAVVSGNDFASVANFGSFLTNIHVPKVSRKRKTLKITKKHMTMLGVLQWLENQAYDEAVMAILDRLKKDKRDSVRQLIKDASLIYQIDDYGITVDMSAIEVVECLKQIIRPRFTNKLFPKYPEWAIDHFFCGRLDSRLIGIDLTQRLLLPTVVERFCDSSVHLVSRRLRQACFGVLKNSNDDWHSNSVMEHLRYGYALKKEPVEVSPYAKETSWQLMSMEEAPLLVDVVGIGMDQWCMIRNELCSQHRFLFITLFYWLKNTTSVVHQGYLNCLLINYIVMFTKYSLISKSSLPNFFVAEETVAVDEVTKCGILERLNNYQKTHNVSGTEVGKKVASVHVFNEFQSCLQALRWLNQLLYHPVETSTLFCAYEGTFCCSLVTSSMMLDFVRKLIDLFDCNVTNLQILCDRIVKFSELFKTGLEPLLSVVPVVKKRVTKRKKKNPAVSSSVKSAVQVSDESEEIADNDDGFIQSFDLENAFDALCIV